MEEFGSPQPEQPVNQSNENQGETTAPPEEGSTTPGPQGSMGETGGSVDQSAVDPDIPRDPLAEIDALKVEFQGLQQWLEKQGIRIR